MRNTGNVENINHLDITLRPKNKMFYHGELGSLLSNMCPMNNGDFVLYSNLSHFLGIIISLQKYVSPLF